MYRCILAFFLFTGIFLPLFGQDVLYLETPSKFKRKQIESGIAYRWEIDGEQWLPSDLEKVRDSLIFIADDSLLVSRITALKIPRKKYVINMFRSAAVMVVILYPAMILINAGAKGFSERWREVALVGLSAMALNQILKRCYYKKVRLDKGKHILRIRPSLEGIF